MHRSYRWGKKEKKLSARATIIPPLLGSDKTVMSLSYEDQVLSPVYVTIGNLNANRRRSQNRLGILLPSSIPIVYKRAEDSYKKDRDLKIKTYYLAFKTMLKYI